MGARVVVVVALGVGVVRCLVVVEVVLGVTTVAGRETEGTDVVVVTGAFEALVSVNANTSSSRGLDHMTRCAARKEDRRETMVLAG